MFRRKNVLPDVPIYFMLSVVPESFGGMVTVALQRSSVFADQGKRKVEILTKSPNMDDPTGRAADLHAAGRLSHSVPIRNAWVEIKTMSDEELCAMSAQKFSAMDPPEDLLAPDGTDRVHRRDEAGQVLQVDYFRPDGTRSISDRVDVVNPGRRGGRRITTFTRSGTVAGQWESLRKFYHSWVDWVIDGKTSILIVDSAPAGGLFFDYQRSHVVTVQAIHNHHVLQMRPDQRGSLNTDVMKMFTHLDWFDAVAVLTQAQQADLLNVQALGGNSFVAPNMLISAPGNGDLSRDPKRGVVIARQVKQKRLDHTLKAIARVQESGHQVRIDFYGNGGEASKLNKLTEELEIGGSVEWKGYDPAAKDKFKTASFTVLSSRYEGHPVAMLEAMSAGCIPIAYDVEYGPSDTITDGVDGFLVPDGDVDALSDRLIRISTMKETDLNRMRRAAVRKSRDFLPDNVMRGWGRALNESLQRKSGKQSAIEAITGRAKLASIARADGGVFVEVSVTGDIPKFAESAQITWIGRNCDAFGRTVAQLSREGQDLRIAGIIPDDRLRIVDPATVLDVYVDVRGSAIPLRARVAVGDVDILGASAGFVPYSTIAGNLSIRHSETS